MASLSRTELIRLIENIHFGGNKTFEDIVVAGQLHELEKLSLQHLVAIKRLPTSRAYTTNGGKLIIDKEFYLDVLFTEAGNRMDGK
ncbi:MAG: hypothetical protein HZA34_00095 [Candidatus Pacebacteria bacterium]|nr:hypothetical protein [Candidatus Paceibacterota bacterium]